ncbi:myb domain protein 55 [Striga asiatica]|uniref:Myb domain protein 55 n=1 Tax=Striga asiatica TaxID=4170 RepID=A0A5A7QQQ2_STRAF|nr:myb domain protein 55 [Striga asiatica]
MSAFISNNSGLNSLISKPGAAEYNNDVLPYHTYSLSDSIYGEVVFQKYIPEDDYLALGVDVGVWVGTTGRRYAWWYGSCSTEIGGWVVGRWSLVTRIRWWRTAGPRMDCEWLV